jgi:hypothetical protein
VPKGANVRFGSKADVSWAPRSHASAWPPRDRCSAPRSERKLSVIIARDVDRVFRPEDYCESFIPVRHLSVSRGGACVGSTATHRSFTPLAFGEIKTFVFVSHCSRTRLS